MGMVELHMTSTLKSTLKSTARLTLAFVYIIPNETSVQLQIQEFFRVFVGWFMK